MVFALTTRQYVEAWSESVGAWDLTLSFEPESETIVLMESISRTYPGVRALRNVNLEIRAGEVHCLVGENGAGKSTLMRILAGAEAPDEGTVRVAGTLYEAFDPRRVLELGVSTIYQERDLVPGFTVPENMFLGHEPLGRAGAIDRAAMHRMAREQLQEIGVELPLDRNVSRLSAAQQQFVQIAKALSRRIRVLIMDEPGAVLSDTELEALFTVVRRLTSSGISVIYISHRLDEIFKIGDRVSVMRQGELVKTTSVSEVTIPEIIRLMVGRRLDENEFRRQTSKTDEIVLSARHLTIRGQLDDVSFDLARGEILGLAGLIGAGRTELLSCLLGVTRPEVGEILLAGRRLRPGSPREAVRQGLGLVPEERREQGLFLGRSVAENVVLPIIDRNSRLGFLLQHRLRHVAESYISRLRIVTPSLEQPVRYLSGGNQQKVVVARWLAAGVRVLLLDEPTRGVDVGAKREIYDIMHELAAEGISIVMASSELPEVLGMSDRVLVMADGRIARELSIEEATKESIMEAAVPRSRLAAVGLAQ